MDLWKGLLLIQCCWWRSRSVVIINNFLCQPSLFVHFGEDLFTMIPKAIVRMQLSNWRDMNCQVQIFGPKRKEIIFGIEMMQNKNKFFLNHIWIYSTTKSFVYLWRGNLGNDHTMMGWKLLRWGGRQHSAPGLNHSAQQEICAPTIAPCCETCVTDSREILCIFVFNCSVLLKMMMGDMFMISLVHAVDWTYVA